MPTSIPPIRLPNAPLAEAVFETRWALFGDASQPMFQIDPGAIPLLSRFTEGAEKIGFGVRQEMAQPYEVGGAAVLRRFYKGNGQPFPVLQVGPGICASNMSADYFWPDFKALSLSSLDLLLDSYPKFDDYPLTINQTEIRYVDIFDTSLVNTKDLIEFIEKVTTWPVGLPKFVSDRRADFDEIGGRVSLSSKLKNLEDSVFSFDLASGLRDAEPVFRLEIKISQRPSNPTKFTKNTIKKTEKWLEDAHGITSPFFSTIIRPQIMKKFGG